MIKLAILGTGSMAHRHAENYLSIKDVKITVVCDTKFDVAEKFAEKYSIPKFSTE